jgi:hypothetical protein
MLYPRFNLFDRRDATNLFERRDASAVATSPVQYVGEEGCYIRGSICLRDGFPISGYLLSKYF